MVQLLQGPAEGGEVSGALLALLQLSRLLVLPPAMPAWQARRCLGVLPHQLLLLLLLPLGLLPGVRAYEEPG